jgi:UMF1 family MFS transporter
MMVAAVLQILLSPISDELGRRRVFVVWFTLLCVTACACLSVAPSLFLGLLLFATANVGYQTAMVFYNAMLGDVADERHKARISGIGVGLGYLGSILGLLVSEKFVDTEHHHYSSVFPVSAAMVLVFALPLFLFVKEKPSLVRLNLAQSLTNSIGSFVTTLRRISRHREMLFFFIGCLLCLDAVHTVIVNMALYCENVVGLDPKEGFDLSPMWKDRVLFQYRLSEINLFLITSTVFAMFGAFGIGHISDKTGHYTTLLAVLILWMAALVLAMFSVQRTLFWITGPMFGLGLGGIWTVSRAYLQEICHPEERSQMFAIFGLASRSAAIIGPFVWARVYSFSNHHLMLNERKSYRLAIAAVLCLMAVGFWVMLLARPKTQQPTRRIWL